MKRIKWQVSTWVVGSECEGELDYEDDEWENMTDEEKEEDVFRAAMEYVEWNYEVEDVDDE